MKKKLLRVTTVPSSLNTLLFGQFEFLRNHFDIVAVSSPGNELMELSIREKIRVCPLTMKREISLIFDFISLIKMIYLILKEKPHIVHANTPKGSLISMTASYLCKVKYRVYTVTGLRFESEFGFKKKLLIFFEKITCFFSNKIIAEGIDVKNTIIDNNLTRKEIELIGNGNINGINENYWNPNLINTATKNTYKSLLNIQSNDFIFIYIGRLTKDKGIFELYDAFNFLSTITKNLKLLVVGENEILSSKYPYNNLHNIMHLGFRNDVRELLSISNALILPSYREGFPNVILQALSMGIPCISTKVNGSKQVINSNNGLLIESHSVNELINSIQFIKNNYVNYNSEIIRNDILNKFSQSFFYPELLKFYKSLK